MPGEIKIGMEFGTYEQMTDKLSKKYNTELRTTSKNLQSEYIFKDENKCIVGNAYKEIQQLDHFENLKYVDSVLFYNNYQYGVADKNWGERNSFDYIQGKSEHAIDINRNGIVDEGETFKGNIDRDAYKKAKEIGNLSLYKKLHNEYNF